MNYSNLNDAICSTAKWILSLFVCECLIFWHNNNDPEIFRHAVPFVCLFVCSSHFAVATSVCLIVLARVCVCSQTQIKDRKQTDVMFNNIWHVARIIIIYTTMYECSGNGVDGCRCYGEIYALQMRNPSTKRKLNNKFYVNARTLD